jgi:hypothetical protein
MPIESLEVEELKEYEAFYLVFWYSLLLLVSCFILSYVLKMEAICCSETSDFIRAV